MCAADGVLVRKERNKGNLGLIRVPCMNPTSLGVMGPGFLNLVPTLPFEGALLLSAPSRADS